jgi:hypothetical protein
MIFFFLAAILEQMIVVAHLFNPGFTILLSAYTLFSYLAIFESLLYQLLLATEMFPR